jgi:phosphatidylinositol alpha-1,6-mannosyltransferase
MARVLIVSWNYPPAVGGIDNLVADVARALGAVHDVTVATRRVPGAAADPRVVRMGTGFGSFLPRALAYTLRSVASRTVDLLIAGSATSCSVTACAATLGRVPAAMLCMGLDLVYPNPLYQAQLRVSLPRHRAVVAISRHTRTLALRAGAAPERLEIIPPGGSSEIMRLIETAPSPEETKERFGHPGRPWLLSVGRVIPRKGLHRFVREIFPRVLRAVPDTLLVIAGDDVSAGIIHREGELALIRAAVAELGLENNVLFAGRVRGADLAALYRAADVFVFPGRDLPHDVEGFGMVVIEAAAAGVPAVVTSCGGIPDTVEDGTTGVIVAPEDAAGYADAVIALLLDPRRRAALGAAARERALRGFTAEAIAPRWLALAQRLLAREPAP